MAVSPSGPAIAEILRTAEPNACLPMSGVNFVPGTTKFDVFSQAPTAPTGTTALLTPVAINTFTATVLLPVSLPAWSQYLVWPNNGGVRGKPFAVNRTEVWWVGPDQVVAGQNTSVFGRNLSRGNGLVQSYVYIAAEGAAGVFATVTGVNPYKIDFTVPTLTPGPYDVWVHNSHGGRFGWSGPVKLNVMAASPWPTDARPKFNVKTYGAIGNGVADDGAAIQAALNAATNQAPSTIYFPAGTYNSSRTFATPEDIRWLGDSRDASVLKLTTTQPTTGFNSFIRGGAVNVLFEKLTINADNRIPSGALIDARGGFNVKFLNARLSCWGGNACEIYAHHQFYDDVEIIGAGSFLGAANQVFYNGCTFRSTNDAETSIANWGGNGISVTNCHVYNADETRSDGHGIGRIFVTQGHFGSTRNLYFGGNQTHNCAPRPGPDVDHNKGEQICLEFVAELEGHAEAVTSTTVRFVSLHPADVQGGVDIIIVGGRGVGQRRRVMSVAANTATLDRPWDVIPDTTTSLFEVTPIAEKVVAYKNTFQGRATYIDNDSNSTAFLANGSCYDMVVDSNTISRMRHGIMIDSVGNTDGEFSVAPTYFALVANNKISYCNNGIYTGFTFGSAFGDGVISGLCNTFRSNIITNISHIGIAIDTWDTAGADQYNIVFDRNYTANAYYGFITASKIMWTVSPFTPTPANGTHLNNMVMRYSNFTRGTAALAGSIGFKSDPFQTFVNLNSNFAGFETGNAVQ